MKSLAALHHRMAKSKKPVTDGVTITSRRPSMVLRSPSVCRRSMKFNSTPPPKHTTGIVSAESPELSSPPSSPVVRQKQHLFVVPDVRQTERSKAILHAMGEEAGPSRHLKKLGDIKTPPPPKKKNDCPTVPVRHTPKRKSDRPIDVQMKRKKTTTAHHVKRKMTTISSQPPPAQNSPEDQLNNLPAPANSSPTRQPNPLLPRRSPRRPLAPIIPVPPSNSSLPPPTTISQPMPVVAPEPTAPEFGPMPSFEYSSSDDDDGAEDNLVNIPSIRCKSDGFVTTGNKPVC